MGLSTFVAMFIGLLRAKFIALTLGPHGTGIFSQAMTFFQSAETICGLGIGIGIVKYVSEAWQKHDMNAAKSTIFVSFILQGVSFSLFFILVCVFSGNLSQFLFSTAKYSKLLIVVSGGVLFSILLISLESTLLGMARPDVFSKSRVVYYSAGFVSLVLLVGALKLNGGFIYIAANAAISFLIVCAFVIYMLRTKIKTSVSGFFKSFKHVNFRPYLKKLFSYGTVMLVSSAITWITVLYVRSILIKECGAEVNGFYQVAFALVGYFSPFFTNGFWGYLLPKLSAGKSASSLNAEINKAARFILIFLVPLLALLFLLKSQLVITIFSKKFLPALEIFPLYLLGSLFFMISYMLGVTFLARKKLNVYFSIGILQNLAYALLFTILVRKMGFLAIAVSYLATNILACLVSGMYQVKKMKLVFNRQNVRLFIAGIIFIGAVFFIPLGPGVDFVVKGIFLICWFLFAVGKKEKALLRSFLRPR